jgi:gliding motility-associated-like protein
MFSKLRIFLFVPPILLLASPLFAQLKGKVELLPGNQYVISVIPDVNWSPPHSITNSAQLTLRAPVSRLQIGNLKNLIGNWSLSNTIKSPVEAPDYEYFSFSLTGALTNLTMQAGIEIPLFSFTNTIPHCCPLEIIDIAKDPFIPPNSLSVNIGNSFSILGAGIGKNGYAGNSATAKVNCPHLQISINPANNPLLCNGGSTNISLTVIGGAPPYQATWTNNSNGASGKVSFQVDGESKTLSAMKAGNFTFFVKDALDSSIVKDFTLSQPSPLRITLQTFDASCEGSLDGSAFVDKVYGGTAKNGFKYYWSTNPTVSSSNIGFLNPGIYRVTVVDDNGCIATDSVEVKTNAVIYPNPVVSQIRCSGDSNGVIDLYPVGVYPPFTYSWSANAKTSNFSSAWKLGPGTYSVTITDATGVCNQVSTFTLNNPLPMKIDYKVSSPDCNQDDGMITINSVINASGNWTSKLEGLTEFSATKQYLIETGIPHKLVVKDSKGCIIADTFALPERKKLFLELGEGLRLKYGQSITLKPEISPLDDIKIKWSPSQGLSCTDCPEPLLIAKDSVTYFLTVTDKYGCSAIDNITLDVHKSRDIFIPNAFSPNHDGINDRFAPFGGFEVVSIQNLKIFDRWGGLIFSSDTIGPNDVNRSGWDGTSEGKTMDAGTYLYTMLVEFVDGEVVLLSGSFTLIR